MRRLINWIYARFLGLRVITLDQRISDLEFMLSELRDEAQQIDADIEILSDQLRGALERRANLQQSLQKSAKTRVDREFPDPVPRSYF